MNKTSIEYLTHTWNPIAMRCTPVSAGCANCWHLKMATRLAGNRAFAPEIRAAYAGEGKPVLVQARLTDPLIHKEPAVIGVQFMGDLFHKDVNTQYIARVFDVMAACTNHVFQILTKRPDRMEKILKKDVPYWAAEIFPGDGALPSAVEFGDWPLSNVWLGVTAEDQATADERIPLLLQTPAAVRFVSLEPLLGAIDLPSEQSYIYPDGFGYNGPMSTTMHNSMIDPDALIDWVIVGGESGPGARPMAPVWVIGIRDQCQEANVPFFFKQWGAWKQIQFDKRGRGDVLVSPRHGVIDRLLDPFPDAVGRDDFKRSVAMARVGRKAAGRLLDGREHNEMPERRKQA